MKILILSLLFFTMNVFAGYMSESKMLNSDCEIERPFHAKKSTCDLIESDCVTVPVGYFCPIFSKLDTLVDNPDSPKFSKTDPEICVNDTNCQIILAAMVCTDTEETAIKRLDLNPKLVYCSKQIGFNQMTVKQIRVDPVKKAAWDINLANPIVRSGIRKTRQDQITAAIATIDTATLVQLRVIIKKMMRDKYTNN